MSEIITIHSEVPIWRAARVRDAMSPTLFRSAELTIGESWSWRRPLMWRFTLTGPTFQVHKAAGDAQLMGATTVSYRYLIAGIIGVSCVVATPYIVRCALANDSSRDYYAARDHDLQQQRSWQAKNAAALEKAYSNPHPNPTVAQFFRDLYNALTSKSYPNAPSWFDDTSWRGAVCSGSCGGGFSPTGGDGSWGRSMTGRGV